jgi:hypothetical protein|tara:strand:+ start:2583 stop:2768 length:186 start_codon:yes stop_codon:yes gene_type:complete
MKKPLKNLNGEYVTAANGKPQRFSKRGALAYGRGDYRIDAPRVIVQDAGTHWLLEREPLKN